MTIWFTSDEHYGHKNILNFCGRPFTDLDEMREGLIKRHNEAVDPGDLVYHLGDMFWRTMNATEMGDILLRLNGNHYYIRGNHEEAIDRNPGIASFFVWVKERERIKPEGGPKRGIVLDHYAGRVWNGSDKGSWQLYGHSHGQLPDATHLLSMDVGVDANEYYPVPLEMVAATMRDKADSLRRMTDEYRSWYNDEDSKPSGG